MTEQSETDKYIKCSKCKCKYINDDEHIKDDFGYNRLNERFKTCVKCRSKNKKQVITNVEIPAKSAPSFLESYVNLPLMKLEVKQNEDMRLDAIVILNHDIDFEPKLRRYDKKSVYLQRIYKT